jgi:replicative DNA helicase
MSSEELATRILSEESGTSSDRIRRGEVRHEDFDKFVMASQRLAAVPLYIDDTPALSVAALRTRARRLMRQQGLGLIIVDHIQLLRPASQGRSFENRVQELSDITRGLKAIAKELDVPVLALSQLSRAVEQREDKRPMLADLRESGSIEQDADVVLFIFREEYYLKNKEPKPGTMEYEQWQEEMNNVHGVAEVIIGKQRHGPTGTVRLQFEDTVTRFSNLASAAMLPAYE